MGYGSAKEMDDDFTSRSAWGDKRHKKQRVTNQKRGIRLIYKKKWTK
jgi:hypothetical protein